MELNIDNHKRLFGLDFLRALAIIFVVIGHGISYFKDHILTLRIFDYLIFDGVNIFFVLSGFLIGKILIIDLEKNRPSFQLLLNFWKRRWLRTLPAYFFILTIIVILSNYNNIYLIPSNWQSFYVFTQNLISPHPNFFNEAWSLSVEEWFYILTPITIFTALTFFKINTKTSIIYISIFIILSVNLLRYYRFLSFQGDFSSGWDTYLRKIVVLRFDSIMFGVLGAFTSFYYKRYFFYMKKTKLIIGILLLCFDKLFTLYNGNAYHTLYLWVFSFNVNSIGTILLFPSIINFNIKQGSMYKLITFISTISYSLYLTNYSLVLMFLTPIANKYILSTSNNFILFITYLTLTFILAILLNKLIEKPFMRLRDIKTSLIYTR